MRSRRAIVLTLLVGPLCASPAMAQRSTPFGVMIGGTFSKFGGVDAKTGELDFTKTHVGFAAGGFVTLGLGRNAAIQPEALYVVKGGKAEAGTSTVKLKLTYFEVPVLLKLRVPPKGKGQPISPHAYVGPALGIKIGCSIKGSDGISTISGGCDDNDISVKSTDISAVFGAGVDVGRAVIDVRYDLGFSRIDGSDDNADVKNRTLYLLVGWTFRSPR